MPATSPALTGAGTIVGTVGYAPPVIVPIEGGEPRTLPYLTENDFPRRWTADGRGLFVARRTPDLTKTTIVLFELATGRPDALRTITLADTSGVRQFSLLVSPDGRTVVYSPGRYLTDLYLVEGLKQSAPAGDRSHRGPAARA